MKTIALDAMGSDRFPTPEVEGAVGAVREANLRVVLVGDEDRLSQELARFETRGLALDIHHATETISMHDAPSLAVRRKRDASMTVATRLVATGKADAVVSAGNSGAMMACALFMLKRLPGVDRPAILTTLPSTAGDIVVLDVGANVECRPLHLLQYAVLGQCYARTLLGRPRPRVALLSNGAEEHKGTALTREAHRLLSRGPVGFDYQGYVEGRDLFQGRIDVVVCEGFAGNLILKVAEGVAEAIYALGRELLQTSLVSRLSTFALKPMLRQVKRKIDYAEWGGAPLVGVGRPAFICHGASNAKAIQNALLHAARYAEHDLSQALRESIAAHETLFALARTPGKRRQSGTDELIDQPSNGADMEEDDSVANHSLRARGPG